MAIRNDQYLFREGPGRGEISPQDPLETRLYDANGNIYDKDNPFEVRVRKLEEILGLAEENPEQYTLAARLKRIEDMLESGSAKVTLTGRIQEFAVSSWDEIAPDEVPAGSVAILIGTNDIRQTDGKEWLPI